MTIIIIIIVHILGWKTRPTLPLALSSVRRPEPGHRPQTIESGAVCALTRFLRFHFVKKESSLKCVVCTFSAPPEEPEPGAGPLPKILQSCDCLP